MTHDPAAAEVALAMSYAPPRARAGLAALFALDETLARVLRTTRQPIIAQMRLTWWHDVLAALDTAPAPANPVLQALAAHVVATVPGAVLAQMIDGWEALLDEPLDKGAMTRFAQGRGGGLFAAAARVIDTDTDRARTAGEGWALADLAAHLSDTGQAAQARALAAPLLAAAMRGRWPVAARTLGARVMLARRGTSGSPARVARLAWHRLTGL